MSTTVEMPSRFVALDIHKHYIVAGAVNAQQQVVLKPRRVSLKAFPGWAGQYLESHDAVVLEATTNAWEFCDLLEPLVKSVSVAHPLMVKLISSARVKTDARDTLNLARLLAANLIPEVWIPPQPVRELRGLVAHRQRQVKRSTQLRNRLHSVLHRHNIQRPQGKLFDPQQVAWWSQLPLSASEKLMVRHSLDELHRLAICKKETEMELARLGCTPTWLPHLPFLMQLPGIGLITALALLAAIGDITRFPSPKQLVGYAGLGSSVHDSGQTHRTGKITKQGRRDIRHAMIECAWTAVLHHPHWQAEFARLAHRIGKHKAIVAVARKLLVVIWHVLTKHEVAHHTQPQTVARKFYKWAAEYRLVQFLDCSRLAFVQQQLDCLGIKLDEFHIGQQRFILTHPSVSG